MFVSTVAVGTVGVPVNAGLVPKDVKADDVLVEVSKDDALAGIGVPFTLVTFGNKVVEDILLKLTDVSIRLRAIVRLTTVTVIGDGDVGRRSVEGMGLALGRRQEWTEARDGTEVEELFDLLEVGVVLGEDGADPVGVAVPVAVDAGDGAVVVELADEGAGCHIDLPYQVRG